MRSTRLSRLCRCPDSTFPLARSGRSRDPRRPYVFNPVFKDRGEVAFPFWGRALYLPVDPLSTTFFRPADRSERPLARPARHDPTRLSTAGPLVIARSAWPSTPVIPCRIIRVSEPFFGWLLERLARLPRNPAGCRRRGARNLLAAVQRSTTFSLPPPLFFSPRFSQRFCALRCPFAPAPLMLPSPHAALCLFASLTLHPPAARPTNASAAGPLHPCPIKAPCPPSFLLTPWLAPRRCLTLLTLHRLVPRTSLSGLRRRTSPTAHPRPFCRSSHRLPMSKGSSSC